MKRVWPDSREVMAETKGAGLRPCYESRALSSPWGIKRSCARSELPFPGALALVTGIENGLEGAKGHGRDDSPEQAIHTGGKHKSQHTREKPLSLTCKQESAN